MPDALKLLTTRRSFKAVELAGPGPSAAEVDALLTVASRVPDHKKLTPWRFIVFEGEARNAAGELFAAACEAEEKPGRRGHAAMRETERKRFLRAPLVIAVVSKVVERPGAPEWEQVLSAGASAFNLCLAANALGYGTSWITEWVAYSPMVRAALGLAPHERIAGFVHIGRPPGPPEDRPRPPLDEIATRFSASTRCPSASRRAAPIWLLAALFGLAVQPVRQASRALLLGLAFWRGRSRRRCGGVPGQAERFEPFGLRAQRRGCRFVLECRLFGVVGALYFGELRGCLMLVGFFGHFAILFHE